VLVFCYSSHLFLSSYWSYVTTFSEAKLYKKKQRQKWKQETNAQMWIKWSSTWVSRQDLHTFNRNANVCIFSSRVDQITTHIRQLLLLPKTPKTITLETTSYVAYQFINLSLKIFPAFRKSVSFFFWNFNDVLIKGSKGSTFYVFEELPCWRKTLAITGKFVALLFLSQLSRFRSFLGKPFSEK